MCISRSLFGTHCGGKCGHLDNQLPYNSHTSMAATTFPLNKNNVTTICTILASSIPFFFGQKRRNWTTRYGRLCAEPNTSLSHFIFFLIQISLPTSQWHVAGRIRRERSTWAGKKMNQKFTKFSPFLVDFGDNIDRVKWQVYVLEGGMSG